MSLERAIRHFVGTDEDLPFEIFDRAGLTDEELEAAIDAGTATMLDVSTADFEFLVRKSDTTTEAPVISKTSGSPVEISVSGTYAPDHATNTQRVIVSLFDTDTAMADGSAVTVRPKVYRYALKRTSPGAEAILSYGDFELVEVPAR